MKIRGASDPALTASRGLTPNIIKVAPSIAVSFYTFETVRDFLCWSQDTHAEEGV